MTQEAAIVDPIAIGQADTRPLIALTILQMQVVDSVSDGVVVGDRGIRIVLSIRLEADGQIVYIRQLLESQSVPPCVSSVSTMP